MPPDDDGARAQLRCAFESYLKGGEPSPSELACAPLLENWCAIVMRPERESVPSHPVMVLAGRVTGHPSLPDATTIFTSPLIWLDRDRKWARSRTRIYRLGARIDGASRTST
ncbi:DUF6634 family protein [Bradyrhizobium embrapense]